MTTYTPAHRAAGRSRDARRARRSFRRGLLRRGFTLTEVLISIALVLILMLGINQVFGLTARAVGAGQALGEMTRAGRAAQSVITQDLSAADFDRGPFLWINSETLPGFRNKEDQAKDLDFDPTSTVRATVERQIRTVDRDGNGLETDANDLTPRPFMTSRNHRVDQMGFFSRTSSRKQMGNGTSFTATVSSGEQYVHYGHLYRPANTAGATASAGVHPGFGFSTPALKPSDNPNNYYATDWILGRMRFIMREPVASGTGTNPPRYVTDDQTGDKVTYYTRLSGFTADAQMEPFRQSSTATLDGNAPVSSDNIQWSYNDVMGTTMARARQDLQTYINTGTHATTWFNNPRFRFTGSPLPTRPLSRQGVSRTVPCFVPHCTQFAVEFAGDFLAQDPATGAVSNYAKTDGTGATDGVVDFIVDPVTKRRTTRWYGFPRDVDGDGQITAARDVVPVRDVAGGQLGFERTVLAQKANYVDTNYLTDTAVPLGANYFVAWGPDAATTGLPRPKQIRITFAVDDPAGRVADEQFFSFVVEVP